MWADWQAADAPFANAQEAASALAAIETLVDYAELDPAASKSLLELPQPGPGFAREAAWSPFELDTGFRPSRNGWRFANSFAPGPIAKVAGLGIGDAAEGLEPGWRWPPVDLWMNGIAPPGDASPPATGSPEFEYLARRQVLARPDSRHAFAKAWPKIRADLAVGRPVPLRLSFDAPAQPGAAAKDGRHHVVGFAATEADDHVEIQVYDPNHPADDSLAIVAMLEPGGEWTIDYPNFGSLASVDRLAYTMREPTPWLDDPETGPASEGVDLTTSGPRWVAAEVERTHPSWLADADGGSGAIDALRAMLHVEAGRAAVLAGDPDGAGHLLAGPSSSCRPSHRPCHGSTGRCRPTSPRVSGSRWRAPPIPPSSRRRRPSRCSGPSIPTSRPPMGTGSSR